LAPRFAVHDDRNGWMENMFKVLRTVSPPRPALAQRRRAQPP
jgi:hypothetical protein